ncbi:MAG: hypothetical protein KF896_15775 [Ignavibacteriae bacterium]|nr:hypothetical protein [Ignavibacteriota bacterium]
MSEFIIVWMLGVIFVGLPVMMAYGIYKSIKKTGTVKTSLKSNYAKVVFLDRKLSMLNNKIFIN